MNKPLQSVTGSLTSARTFRQRPQTADMCPGSAAAFLMSAVCPALHLQTSSSSEMPWEPTYSVETREGAKSGRRGGGGERGGAGELLRMRGEPCPSKSLGPRTDRMKPLSRNCTSRGWGRFCGCMSGGQGGGSWPHMSLRSDENASASCPSAPNSATSGDLQCA